MPKFSKGDLVWYDTAYYGKNIIVVEVSRVIQTEQYPEPRYQLSRYGELVADYVREDELSLLIKKG